MIWILIAAILFLVAFFAIRNSKAGKAWKKEQARKEREAKAEAEMQAWLKQYKKGERQRQKDDEESDAWLESLDDNLQPKDE